MLQDVLNTRYPNKYTAVRTCICGRPSQLPAAFREDYAPDIQIIRDALMYVLVVNPPLTGGGNPITQMALFERLRANDERLDIILNELAELLFLYFPKAFEEAKRQLE